MTGILAWLAAQAHVMVSVLGAVVSDQPAPARQVVIYTAVLATVMSVVPKALKKLSK